MPRRGGLAGMAAAAAASATGAQPSRSVDDNTPLNPQRASEAGLCALAKKVPQVPRGLSQEEFDRQCLRRNGLVNVIQLLDKHPYMSMECWSWLDGKVNGKKSVDDGTWDASYSQWLKVPKYWLAQWMAKYAQKEDGLTEDLLDKIDGQDRDNVRRIFGLMTMVMPYDVIPKSMLDKEVMGHALNRRAKDVGFDIKGFVKGAVSGAGVVDWTVGYPFKFTWSPDASRVTQCANMFGETHDMEAHEVITNEFSLSYAFDPRQAVVSKGGCKIMLCDLFSADAKIRRMALDKKASGLVTVAEEAVAEIAAREQARQNGMVDEGQVVLKDTALKEQRKRQAQTARAKNDEHKLKRKATVDLRAVTQHVG